MFKERPSDFKNIKIRLSEQTTMIWTCYKNE